MHVGVSLSGFMPVSFSVHCMRERRHVLVQVPDNAAAHRKSRVFMQSGCVHVCKQCLIMSTCRYAVCGGGVDPGAQGFDSACMHR